jgi:hypothetical protein
VGTVTALWDVYLDAADAAPVLHAVTTLERHRAVREPLPFDDADRLLERLAMVASIAEEEAVYWRREAVDRHEETAGGGGRWGDADIAGRMATSAHLLADGSVEVALAAHAAAQHLADRLRASRVDGHDPRS